MPFDPMVAHKELADCQLEQIVEYGISYRYHLITVSNRKNDKGMVLHVSKSLLTILDPTILKPYGLFDLEEEPAIRPYTKLKKWIDLLSNSSVIHRLSYVFRVVADQSIKDRPLETAQISKYLEHIRVAVGLENVKVAYHTTYCFRRGGPNTSFFMLRSVLPFPI
jgi:hypothetical protein